MMFPTMRTLAFMAIKEWHFLSNRCLSATLSASTPRCSDPGSVRVARGVITWHRQIVNQHDKAVQEGTSSRLSMDERLQGRREVRGQRRWSAAQEKEGQS